MSTDPHHPPWVFLSSTAEDLAEYRRAALDAVLRRGFQCRPFEYWEGADNPPLAECLQRVDANGDLVLAIVARRHGWTPPDQAAGGFKSITRLECERAAGRGCALLPFFLDDGVDDATWGLERLESHRLQQAMQQLAQGGPAPDFNALAAEIERNRTALAEFRTWLADGRQVRRFRDPEGLANEVERALDRWLRDHPQHHPAGTDAAFNPARYRAWLVRQCQSIELLGLDPSEAQNARLQQVYVPALVPAANPEKQDLRHGQERQGDLLLERLGDGSLYVPGAPGAGKSTFCRWLALVVAGGALPPHEIPPPEGFEETLPEDLARRLPLICPLRHLGRARVPGADGTERLLLRGSGRWTRALLEQALAAWLDHGRPGGLGGGAFLEALHRGELLLILDGADELPVLVPEGAADQHPRANLLSGLADALPDWHAAGNRVLLTSRPYGLSGPERARLGLPEARLQPLPEPLQGLFVRRWYRAVDRDNSAEKSAGLTRLLNQRARDDVQGEGIREMRRNPMLLTALCVKYDEGKTLPRDVHELYDKVVAQVLYNRYPDETRRAGARRRLAAVALGMHTGAALGLARAVPAAAVGREEVERILERLAEEDPRAEKGSRTPLEKRERLLSDSGLLRPRGDDEAEFYHLSFQEFLAAAQLERREVPLARSLAEHAAVPAWRRTLMFRFAADARRRGEQALVPCQEALLPLLTKPEIREQPAPALLLGDCLEIAAAHRWTVEDFRAPLMAVCEALLDPQADPKERAALWEAAGRLGFDRRAGIGVVDGIPELAWCRVPAGKVRLKNAKQVFDVNAFRIARHPVTQAQFQAFVEAPDGYRDPGCWEPEWLERGWVDPTAPPDPQWSAPNLPRERVNWWEALAFGRWLNRRLHEQGELGPQEQLRLPTEWEWQQAATGGLAGREWPWEGAFDPAKANTSEGGVDRTTAVGIYPTGVSPVGALDMAGNVWEWCLNAYDDPKDTGIGGTVSRAVRGGSWILNRDFARAAFRDWLVPDSRFDDLGFRLCVSSPILSIR